MNNIEKITERILADAQAQADELLAQAKQEAAQIKARCQAQAQAEYDRILSQGEIDAATQLQRLDSADEAQGRRAILTEKQEQLELTFQAALERLCRMDDAERASFLAQLAANNCTTGTEEVILSTADRESIGQGVVEAANLLLDSMGRKGGLTLSDTTRSTLGGLYLRSGSIETNCTFESLLRQARETESSQVAALLFS